MVAVREYGSGLVEKEAGWNCIKAMHETGPYLSRALGLAKARLQLGQVHLFFLEDGSFFGLLRFFDLLLEEVLLAAVGGKHSTDKG